MDPDLFPIRKSRVEPLLRPVQAFLSAESAGGMLLLVATVVALAWANSPWGEGYQHFWHAKAGISAGAFSHSMSLEHWVNDGLMVIFFLLVGLEIKREILIGELASVRRATLPAVAAIGGMVVPAAIYLMFNASGPGARGWGIPMATDIAFAVGVLAIVGRNVPTSAKVFLLAVAIVDDLGAVIVIALFYTSDVSGSWLGIAGLFLIGLIALNLLRVHRPLPYVLLGIGLWAATLSSGVHATIAGVLLAFTIPATRQAEEGPFVEFVRSKMRNFEQDATAVPDKLTEDQSHALKEMEEASQAVQTPLARLEHALLRPVNFLIVPLFALANAGVDLRSGAAAAFGDPITWGIALGLLLGKPLGILLACWLALKLRIAALPEGASRRHLVGVGVLCGIGFTMSLFVANLAFEGHADRLAAAKVGILMGSLAAVIAGALIINLSRAAPSARAGAVNAPPT